MKRTIITATLTLIFTAFAIQAVEQTAFSGAGIIHSTSGGFKFPDGSVQTTAAGSAQVAAVDCTVNNLQSAIDELDKSIVNSLDISGDCTEDVVVAGFTDLTLIGSEGASLSATSFIPGDRGGSTMALFVEYSKLTVQTLTINGGRTGVSCRRSTCVIRDTIIEGGHDGVTYTDQSLGEVLGSTEIRNGVTIGLGIYSGSSVHVRLSETYPTPDGPGPIISGHGYVGAIVQDGSFMRADNATFSGNLYGISANRNAVIRLYGDDGGVINNVNDGIYVEHVSTAAVATPITGNGGAGIVIGPLSSVTEHGTVTFDGNIGGDVVCNHVTAISQPSDWCGN